MTVEPPPSPSRATPTRWPLSTRSTPTRLDQRRLRRTSTRTVAARAARPASTSLGGEHGQGRRSRLGRSRHAGRSRPGIVLSGARDDRTYTLSTDRVLVDLGGPLAALDALDPARRSPSTVDVDGLAPGSHEVSVEDRRLPAGVDARRVSPRRGHRRPSPQPPRRPSPPPSPSPSPVARPEPSMARLFGTDGIRGVANVDLKPTLAHALGRATAHALAGPGRRDRRRPGHPPLGRHVRGGHRGRRDEPRASTSTSSASCPTPALAFLAGSGGFAAGIMVSASHNPAEDNGLKVLDAAGLKLDDDVEDELEAAHLAGRASSPAPRNAGLGRIDRRAPALLDRYRDHRLGLAAARRATDLRIVARLRRTARAASSAPTILAATGAQRSRSSTPSPDGVNINLGCGATAPGVARRRGRRPRRRPRLRPRRRRRPAASPSTRHGRVVDGDQLLGHARPRPARARRARRRRRSS